MGRSKTYSKGIMPNWWEKISRKNWELSCNKNHSITKENERTNGKRICNKEDDCQGKEERKVVNGTPIIKGDGYLLKMVWSLKNQIHPYDLMYSLWNE